VADGSSDGAIFSSGTFGDLLRGELDDKETEAYPWTGQVDKGRQQLLAYGESLYREDADLPAFRESALGQLLLANGSTEELADALREGRVGQVQASIGIERRTDDATDALGEVVRRLSQEGTIAAIVGPPGAGKTSTLLDVARAWGAWTGGTIVGNVGWGGLDERVETDVAMLEAMASVDGQTLGLIDEANKGNLTGRGADTNKAEKFADRGTMIRKAESKHGPHAKRGSLLYVTHNWKRMNAPARRMTTLVIAKPSRQDPGKVVLYESEGGEDSRDKVGTFVGLTDTRERYNEHEASAFDVVLDGEDTDAESGPSPEEIRRAERVRSFLLDCRPWDEDAGTTQKKAAKKAGFSTSWATERKSEWQAGEWSHLEDVPEPDDG